MRVFLFTPTYFPTTGGNSTTVHRIATHLRQLGVDVHVAALSQIQSESDLGKAVRQFRPHLLHAFHAFKCGVLTAKICQSLNLPLIVTLTGTDANEDLFHPQRRKAVMSVLEKCSAVVAFHESLANKVTAQMPQLKSKFHIIPQGVWFPQQRPFSLREELGFGKDDFLFFLPAGIRAVKQPLFAIPPLTELHKRHPQIKLVFAGEPLEKEVFEALQAHLNEHPWARYIGVIDYEKMHGAYRSVEVVLNTSKSEGGMSNAVLEAMAAGTAVLARDIEGNSSIIEHGVTGLLFRDKEDFREQAFRLIEDADLRRRLAKQAQKFVREHFDPAKEARAYRELCEAVVL